MAQNEGQRPDVDNVTWVICPSAVSSIAIRVCSGKQGKCALHQMSDLISSDRRLPARFSPSEFSPVRSTFSPQHFCRRSRFWASTICRDVPHRGRRTYMGKR